MNSYELSRKFFDWSFENPEKISPTHIAMYFFIIEHCNRLGWKEKFGLPTSMVKDAIGIKNYKTYISALNNLVEWGFIIMVEKSKNQYSSNIIAIANFTKAPDKANTKALDKALQKHNTKQVQSTVSIDKQLNKEQETINNDFIDSSLEILKTNSVIENCKQNYLNNRIAIEALAISTHQPIERIEKRLNEFCIELISKGNITYLQNDFNQYFVNWFKKKIEQMKLDPNVFVTPNHVHR
jgi:glucan-binding YG repeat protein